MDYIENKLYVSNVGQIWLCDEVDCYSFSFKVLEDSKLYAFGAMAGKEDFIYYELDETKVEKVVATMKMSIQMQHQLIPKFVGNLGSHIISVKGDKPFYLFKSCYTSVEDLLESVLGNQKSGS